MIKNKKSQITVFIIIGVILLFSTALVLYIKNQVSVQTREVKVSVEKVPNEVQPVQAYVSQCLESVSKEAFNLLGSHGGYIDVGSGSMDYAGVNFEKNEAKPTEADMVAFPPKTDNYVVYWEFMRKPDQCKVCYLGSWRPPLYRSESGNSIESQVDKYVEKNLRGCLKNFESFRKEGYTIKEEGGLKATTYVRETDVIIALNYTLEVSKGDAENIKMSLYQVELPINFKKIYDMAVGIIETSADSRFLGINTLNLISGFSRVDKNALPPFSDLTFDYNSVKWSKRDVKQLMTQMLQVYVQGVQMEGTSNFKTPARFKDPFMKGLYGAMVLPGKEVTSLSVNFMYLGWPIYLDFVGSNSDTLKPSALEMPLLNLLPFRDYSFVYDLSYPVIVRLSDPRAYGGKGYTFVFAMETNIRNNEAVSDEFITIPAMTLDQESLTTFCSDEQRNSGDITIRVIDAETNKPLEGASVAFRSSQQCGLGVSELNNNQLSWDYGTASVTAKFPVGIGTLIISRPQYETKYERFATAVNKSEEKTVYLNPVKILNATISKKKIIVSSILGGVLGTPENLTKEDIAFVTFNKIKENVEEDPFASAAAYAFNRNETNQVMLVPGKYEVTITYLYNKTVVIPEDEVCEGGFAGIGETCAKLPELTFPVYTFPVLQFEWNVTAEELAGAKTVDFFTIYSETPKDHDDLTKIPARFHAFKNNMNYLQYKPVIG